MYKAVIDYWTRDYDLNDDNALVHKKGYLIGQFNTLAEAVKARVDFIEQHNPILIFHDGFKYFREL